MCLKTLEVAHGMITESTKDLPKAVFGIVTAIPLMSSKAFYSNYCSHNP